MGKASREKWERRLLWAAQNNQLASAPPPDPPTLWSRFLSFAENNMSLTAIGIIGGVGALLFYGPILSVCVLLFLLGLHRSRAVHDLSIGRQTLCYLLVFVSSGGGLYELGHAIEQHKEHPLTAAEIVKAIKEGTPLPITQQVTNVFNPPPPATPGPVVVPNRSPDIEFGTPLPAAVTNGSILIDIPFQNAGDATALRTSLSWDSIVRPVSNASANELFKILQKRARDERVETEPIGPKDRRTYIGKAHYPTGEDLRNWLNGQRLYFGVIATYFDNIGKESQSETCVYFEPNSKIAEYCQVHQGIVKQ